MTMSPCRCYRIRIILKILTAVAILPLYSLTVFAQGVNFDFKDADLRTVIQAVAEFTGKNFLVDPAVQGKVTIVAPTVLTEEEAYKAFQSVLEVNGFVTVETDGVIKIVPAEKGRTQESGTREAGAVPNSDEMITRVLQLEYIQSENLVQILRPLIPPYAHLAYDNNSSSVILTDRAANVARLVNIIKSLDRPAKTGDVEIVTLANASSEELAKIMGKLHQTPGGEAGSNNVVVMADPRTNSLIIKADDATRGALMTLANTLDSPLDTSGNTHVIYLKNADAVNVTEVLQKTLKNGEGGNEVIGDVIITADPDTNSLIVTAPKSEFITIERVVRQLDLRRLQIYIEALIAEVSTDKAGELGVQWQSAQGLEGDRTGFVGRSDFDIGTSIADIMLNPLAAGAGLSLGYIDGAFTLPDGTEVLNLSVLARALENQSDANVLSTPNLLTMDNQEAEIVIGQNVPFITGAYSQINQGTAVANPFQTIERRDVGLTLRIRPQITEGGTIKMDIFQEVSSVAQKGEAQDIVTNTRSLRTTVVAENNRMVVLGGLIQDDITVNEQKVPLLGDIPILGHLFKYENQKHKKTNLLVFLRPLIVRAFTEMDEPTRRKYQYLSEMTQQQALRKSESDTVQMRDWQLIQPAGSRENSESSDPGDEAGDKR
jgi:general secretion pathway protein D